MKKLLVLCAALLFVVPSISSAQGIPMFEWHFEDWGEAVPTCPGVGVLDTGYVMVENYNMWLTAISYQIEFPPEITWGLDQIMGNGIGFMIGSSPAGAAVAWQLPQPCFPSFRAIRVLFTWQCSGCPRPDIPVVVNAYPGFPCPQATQWRTDPPLEICGVGMTSLVCPTVPTEETSWGRIKSLYQ